MLYQLHMARRRAAVEIVLHMHAILFCQCISVRCIRQILTIAQLAAGHMCLWVACLAEIGLSAAALTLNCNNATWLQQCMMW